MTKNQDTRVVISRHFMQKRLTQYIVAGSRHFIQIFLSVPVDTCSANDSIFVNLTFLCFGVITTFTYRFL